MAELERGENPLVLARMESGFAVMFGSQFLPGYCLLLASPQVDHLTDLPMEARSRYLLDMSILGQAIHEATGCRRMNYGIYGNLDPFLHAHVVPRYEWEPDEFKFSPPGNYPSSIRDDAAVAYSDEKHGELRKKIEANLRRLM